MFKFSHPGWIGSLPKTEMPPSAASPFHNMRHYDWVASCLKFRERERADGEDHDLVIPIGIPWP